MGFAFVYRRPALFIPAKVTLCSFLLPSNKEQETGIESPPRRSLQMNSLVGKGSIVLDSQDQVRFETLVLPHLDAAFNLARWLLRNGADAEDVSQEAMLRAYRFFNGFHGGDVRAWLLQIVRNTCFTWLEKNRRVNDMAEFDEELHGTPGPTPESLAIAADSRGRLTHALESLPSRYREVIVLRELEGCSYKEIATITSIPVGTVMSRVSRARRQLQLTLADPANKEAIDEL
jgi:RNA polymerase sigma-70 factor (ECF subfamily)